MKYRTPAAARVAADIQNIIRRLMTEAGATLEKLGGEYGVSYTTMKLAANRAMKPSERSAWLSRVRKESARQPAGRRTVWVPIGTIRERGGHRWIKFADIPRHLGKGWKLLARWRWEQAHGVLPKGRHVIFKDGDTLNDALGNLEVITPGRKFKDWKSADPQNETRRVAAFLRARRAVAQQQRAKRAGIAAVRAVVAPPPPPVTSRAASNVAAFLASLDAA